MVATQATTAGAPETIIEGDYQVLVKPIQQADSQNVTVKAIATCKIPRYKAKSSFSACTFFLGYGTFHRLAHKGTRGGATWALATYPIPFGDCLECSLTLLGTLVVVSRERNWLPKLFTLSLKRQSHKVDSPCISLQ